MYGDVVLGVPEHRFQDVLTELRRSRGVEDDSELSAEDLETATTRFRDIVEEERPGELPEDPMEQVKGAITAVFLSWNTKRAVEYRRIHSIPDDLGTAANVQMMVFGDLGDDSGTGVCFTRDPGTGEKVDLRRLSPPGPGRGRRGRHPQHLDPRPAGRPPSRVPSPAARDHGRSREPTTATCATSSSRSSETSSTSSRPEPGRGRRRRR